ncbi:MAG: CPBP family intramembrane metalloprotease [Verrucomicrobiaceae bacterium]|nr:MAG: CPBP family intramembrane metalloprotease [Verrucomicrobiaceae bacterium]
MLWVLCALVLAAAIVPWVYQAGKSVAEMILASDAHGALEEFAKSSQRAKFGRYYSRSLIFSAVVLMPFLYWRIQRIRQATGYVKEPGAPLCWKVALSQGLIAFGIAAGLLWGTGMALEMTGAYVLDPDPPSLAKFVKKIVIPALAVPLVEEWLIRGVLLGLWLRLAKPFAACLGTSLFFAFIHFLDPPAGSVILNPTSPLAGFELLGKILLHLTEPQFIVTDFVTLLAIGLVLAWARLRTGALWFSIGLHAGWIFAFKGFNYIHQSVPEHPLRPWGVGESLRSGLVPLLTLALTALLCHFVMRAFEQGGRPVSRASR